MKKSRDWRIWLLCLFVVASGVAFWRLVGSRKPTSERERTVDQLRQAAREPSDRDSSGENTAHANPQVIKPMEKSLTDRARQAETDVTGKNVPVNFWGRVIDQDGAPLAGVRIVMAVRQWHFRPPIGLDATFPKTEVFTDAGGQFQLIDAKGDNLVLESVDKAGYRLSSKMAKSFTYGESPERFFPDASSPVVIRMWKALPAEPLKTFRTSKMIPYDGTPIKVDLLEGKLVEGGDPGGDLIVRLERNPRDIAVTNRAPFDWRATILAGSGGIAPAGDELAHIAPLEGYGDRIEIDMPKSARNWSPVKEISFFIKGHDGKLHGLVKTEFRANYSGPKTGFSMEAFLNTNGSRIIQP
jgi:hypothetical protein